MQRLFVVYITPISRAVNNSPINSISHLTSFLFPFYI
jgi:hypothetical protein